MVNNTLDKIIKKKTERLVKLKKSLPLESLEEHMPDTITYIDFKETIEENIAKNKISIIAEIKKASPSAGIIVKDYNPIKIAEKYNDNKVTCLSVLTEEDFFLGDLKHLYKIKLQMNPIQPTNLHLPILCKHFFIDPYQIHLA